MGRVGEAPGLQQPQPRGIRGSSAARPSGRRRDLAGRTTEAGFNIFTQHGECVWEPALGSPGVGLGRGGRQTGSSRGSRGGRVPESGGGIRCHLGQSREASHTPPPLPSPAWLAAPGGREGKRSGLRDRGWTVLYLGTLCGSVKTVDSVPRGGNDAGRCELNPVGVSVNRSLAKGTGCASRDLEIGTESQETVAYKVYVRVSHTKSSVRIVSSDLKYSTVAKIRVVS